MSEFVTTLSEAIPDGMTPSMFMRCPVAAEFLADTHPVGLRRIRERLIDGLGREPDVMLLLDREQTEFLFSEQFPSLQPDDRMMVALTLRCDDAES